MDLKNTGKTVPKNSLLNFSALIATIVVKFEEDPNPIPQSKLRETNLRRKYEILSQENDEDIRNALDRLVQLVIVSADRMNDQRRSDGEILN